ncbi:MAG TPA: ribosome-associated translation inhibitor RaiA [Flavobacteriales bacterium]|jgi:putative sigma-54 modulation protein|nr:ribosome-associated translation inhibitor RaiA [Flavobacteriales bacterium]
MKLDIQSIRFDADQKLIDHIEKKASKLDKYFDNIISGQVFLKLEKSEDRMNKNVEIRLEVPGNDLFASKRASTFEEASDEAIDALTRQVKKLKEKLKSK